MTLILASRPLEDERATLSFCRPFGKLVTGCSQSNSIFSPSCLGWTKLYCYIRLNGTVQMVCTRSLNGHGSTLSQIVAAHNGPHLEFSLCFVKQQYFFFKKLQSRPPLNLVSLKYDEVFRIRIAMSLLRREADVGRHPLGLGPSAKAKRHISHFMRDASPGITDRL